MQLKEAHCSVKIMTVHSLKILSYKFGKKYHRKRSLNFEGLNLVSGTTTQMFFNLGQILAGAKRSHKEAHPKRIKSKRIVTNTTSPPPKFVRKNPINQDSKDPLRPPSRSEDYTLFSGFPIRRLQKNFYRNKKESNLVILEAIEQKTTPAIQCGSTRGFLNENKLWQEENKIIKSNSIFAFALAKLRCWEKDAPRIHTNLNLHQWLVDLSDLNMVEAADAYWGVSRGVEILDKNLNRDNTKTPNYYKKEHKDLFNSEIDRVCKEGYICKYEDLVKIWPNLSLEPQDVLGCGFIVKKKVI